jgi:hypothetical protein
VKKILTALVATLALAFSGAAFVAPAQADVEPQVAGTSIYFDVIQDGIPKTIDLRNTSTTGYQYLQSYGTIRNNVAKTCPKNDNYKLMFVDSYGSWHYLAPGACYRPLRTGRISVGVFKASYPF